MDIQVILNQMAVLFILMILGFILGKAKFLTVEANKIFTKIILFVALPAFIIDSVMNTDLELTLGTTLYAMLISFVPFAISFLVSYPIIRTLGDKDNRGLYIFMTMFGNTAFMGIPIIIAVFGPSAVFYASLVNIAFNVLVFSVGIMIISRKGTKFNPKILLNPNLLITLILIPLALSDITFPFQVSEPIRITGAMTTPGAMLIIGSTLSFIPAKSIFMHWRIFPMTLLKLIIIPAVTWLILRQFIGDELLLGVLVVLSAMPTAVSASMLAIEYGGDEQVASAGVFITTLLCGVTVPALVYFLLM